MCEMPTIFNSDTFKARKEHTCCECGGTISPGEEYVRNEGLWVGEWGTYKQCLACNRLQDWMISNGSECVAFTQVYDHLINDFLLYGEPPPSELIPEGFKKSVYDHLLEDYMNEQWNKGNQFSDERLTYEFNYDRINWSNQ